MTRPKEQHPLTAGEIKLAQLVARGLTDEEIAELLRVKVGTVRGRINGVYHRAGVVVHGPRGTAGMTRLRLVIWAYESGTVTPDGDTPGVVALPPSDRTLVERAFEVCRQLVHRRPYSVVRDEAVAVIREADADLRADEAAA